MPSEERRTCRTPTPGKQPTSIPVWKYSAIRDAILKVVPEREPGVAAKDLPKLVADALQADIKEKLGSIAWHTTTVKLDMEVRNELRRLPKVKPQHLVRT